MSSIQLQTVCIPGDPRFGLFENYYPVQLTGRVSVEEFNNLMTEIDNIYTIYVKLRQAIQKKSQRALLVLILLSTPTFGMIYTYRQFKKIQQEASKTYLEIKNCLENANKIFFPRGVQFILKFRTEVTGDGSFNTSNVPYIEIGMASTSSQASVLPSDLGTPPPYAIKQL